MNSLRIGFTGDFCPWKRIGQAHANGDWKPLFNEVQPFFKENDFNVIDLECPLTRSEIMIPKTGPHIKSDPATAEILRYLNCQHVTTANNHFKDYSWKGMQDSYKALESEGISWLGSGKNIVDASKPAYLEKEGLKVAIINMAENEWSTTNGDLPGCNPIDYPRALSSIQNARAKSADFIVVILHGGHEHYPLPSPRMKAQFRFMVDAGADAVVGHHTHVVSGYEVYKNKPIFYGLGNFCFDWNDLRNSPWNIGMMLRLVFPKEKDPCFEYQLIAQNDEKAGLYLLDEQKTRTQESRIKKLNAIIANDTELTESFDKYCERLKPVMLSRIQPYRNKYLVALHKRGFLPDIMNKKKRKMLQILMQCESHREVLLHSLNESITP